MKTTLKKHNRRQFITTIKPLQNRLPRAVFCLRRRDVLKMKHTGYVMVVVLLVTGTLIALATALLIAVRSETENVVTQRGEAQAFVAATTASEWVRQYIADAAVPTSTEKQIDQSLLYALLDLNDGDAVFAGDAMFDEQTGADVQVIIRRLRKLTDGKVMFEVRTIAESGNGTESVTFCFTLKQNEVEDQVPQTPFEYAFFAGMGTEDSENGKVNLDYVKLDFPSYFTSDANFVGNSAQYNGTIYAMKDAYLGGPLGLGASPSTIGATAQIDIFVKGNMYTNNGNDHTLLKGGRIFVAGNYYEFHGDYGSGDEATRVDIYILGDLLFEDTNYAADWNKTYVDYHVGGKVGFRVGSLSEYSKIGTAEDTRPIAWSYEEYVALGGTDGSIANIFSKTSSFVDDNLQFVEYSNVLNAGDFLTTKLVSYQPQRWNEIDATHAEGVLGRKAQSHLLGSDGQLRFSISGEFGTATIDSSGTITDIYYENKSGSYVLYVDTTNGTPNNPADDEDIYIRLDPMRLQEEFLKKVLPAGVNIASLNLRDPNFVYTDETISINREIIRTGMMVGASFITGTGTTDGNTFAFGGKITGSEIWNRYDSQIHHLNIIVQGAGSCVFIVPQDIELELSHRKYDGGDKLFIGHEGWIKLFAEKEGSTTYNAQAELSGLFNSSNAAETAKLLMHGEEICDPGVGCMYCNNPDMLAGGSYNNYLRCEGIYDPVNGTWSYPGDISESVYSVNYLTGHNIHKLLGLDDTHNFENGKSDGSAISFLHNNIYIGDLSSDGAAQDITYNGIAAIAGKEYIQTGTALLGYIYAPDRDLQITKNGKVVWGAVLARNLLITPNDDSSLRLAFMKPLNYYRGQESLSYPPKFKIRKDKDDPTPKDTLFSFEPQGYY
jgi:hypothetical protein